MLRSGDRAQLRNAVSSTGTVYIVALLAGQRSAKMASVPLLDGENAEGNGDMDAHILLEEQPDFAQVIAADPEGVIAYIEQKGVQDLGTFKVQVRDA